MKRKGFTLVELLIVIAILGTLTAMMTLSSTDSTASAEAAKVVNALRTARTAAVIFYWDHPDYHDYLANSDVEGKKFSDILAAFNTEKKYYIESAPGGNTDCVLVLQTSTAATKASAVDWYVGYILDGKNATDAVRAKLAAQAASYGLLGTTYADAIITPPTTAVTDAYDGTSAKAVLMKVRGPAPTE